MAQAVLIHFIAPETVVEVFNIINHVAAMAAVLLVGHHCIRAGLKRWG